MEARLPRRVLLLLALGLLLRLVALPAWGTLDVEIQKAWAGRAATGGLADMYGPPDAELLQRAREQGRGPLSVLLQPQPRTWFDWGGQSYFVDYPPGSLIVLWAAGRLYLWLAPELDRELLFNAAVNLAPLLGSLLIAGLLWRSSPEHGSTRALAFWLNPALLLAAPLLGYQDTVFGSLALLAVLLMQRGRLAGASAAVVAAGLLKPQGALLLPALAVVLLREGRWRDGLRAVLAGLAVAAALLAPWWSSGYLLSALDGARRPLGQLTLAPLGLNVWWVAGWLMRWDRQGPFPLAEIVQIPRFAVWAGFDPRLPARLLLLVATLAVAAWLWHRLPRERWALPLAVILQVHAYALVGTSVHENHTFLAVILAPLLLGEGWPQGRRFHALTSAFLFTNLFLMVGGLGRGLMRARWLVELRRLTVVDLSVIVALLHVALVAWLFARAWRAPGPAREEERA